MRVFLDAVKLAHIPDLHKKVGMVCQLWEDGEITLQKAGDLYGQRNLHMIVPGKIVSIKGSEMPVPAHDGHGFAFIESTEKAAELRKLLGDQDHWDR